MFFAWIGAAIGIILLIWVIFVFNLLIKNKNRVKNAWADVDVQLKRRYDLIPNLVEIVRGYKNYEASVLENVTKARTDAMNQTSVSSKTRSEEVLSNSLKSLLAVSENYPQLKSSENFLKLQSQLATIEDDIQSARRYYNAASREMNIVIQSFPNSIVAKIFTFKQSEFFGADENEKESVKISL